MLQQVRKALASGDASENTISSQQIRTLIGSLYEQREPVSAPPDADAPLPAGAGDPPPPAVDDSDEDDDPQPNEQKDKSKDPAKGFAALLARHDNDGVAAARELYGENRSLRAQKQLLTEENRNLQRSLPRGDKTVVTKQQAGLLREWEALKMTPAQMRQAVADLRDLRQKDQVRAKAELLDTVASIAGYNPEALKHVGKDLDYVIKGDGDNKQALVRVKNADNTVTEIAVSEYAQSNWSWAMNSLTANGNTSTQQRQQSQNQQRRVPQQYGPNSGNGNNANDKVSNNVIGRYDGSPIPGVRIEKAN